MRMLPKNNAKYNLLTGLILAIILDTAGQLLWKFSAAQLPQTAGIFPLVKAAIRQPYFLAVLTIFSFQLVNWLAVLKKADLSYAQPITSLSYITVCGLSAVLFGEPIGAIKMLGIMLVMSGVYCLSQSQPKARA